MKLKKTKKDIIEAIKSASLKKKNEMFEINSKVQAVAPPSFVNALEMSAKNKQMVIDRMKEKEKERKELEAQTVERKANETPKTDAMKKMKMVEEFVNASFKDKFIIKENVCIVTTKSRAELKTLIENARKHEVKYTIERINEEYRFNYKFESLNKKLNEERKYVAGFFSKGNIDSYTEMSSEKWNSLDSDVKVKDLLDMWWNSVRIKGKGIKGTALLYKACHDGSYELDEDHNSHGEDILNMTVHTHYEYDEDADGYPIIYAKLLSKEVKDEEFNDKINVEKCRDIMKNQIDWTDVDASGDVRFAIDQVRSLRSENVISDDEYDYIMSNWDKLQESKKLKEDKKDTDKKADLQKEINWCNSVLNNPKGRAAMDAKANYGKGYVAQVKRDLVRFEKQLKQLDESKKTIKEGLADSKYKALIGEHFDHSFDFEFLDIVAHTLDRIDFESNEELSAEDIDDAVNDALIYTADQWTVAKFYASSPADLDWNDVLEEFSSDISQLADKIAEGTEGEEDEEDEELDRLNHLKDLYDIEPGDLTEDEIKELQDAGMLED